MMNGKKEVSQRWLTYLGTAVMIVVAVWIGSRMVGFVFDLWIIKFLVNLTQATIAILALGMAAFVWRMPLGQLRKFITALEEILPIKRVVIMAVLTAIYGSAIWFLYVFLAPAVRDILTVQERTAYLVVTVLGLPTVPAIWHLYKAAEIPGDQASVNKGLRMITLAMFCFFALWFHLKPNELFDPKTGEPRFWVAAQEERIYHFPIEYDRKGNLIPRYSPETGERLRLGTPEDAGRFRRSSWFEGVGGLFDGWKKRAEARRAFAAEVERIRNLPIDPEVVYIEPPEVGERTVVVKLEPGRWKRFRLPYGSSSYFSFDPPNGYWVMRAGKEPVRIFPNGSLNLGNNSSNRFLRFLVEKEAEVTFIVWKTYPGKTHW